MKPKPKSGTGSMARRRPAIRRRWVINPRTRVKESARVYDRKRVERRVNEGI